MFLEKNTMNWFNNLNMRAKLLYAFLVTIIISGIIGGLGYYNASQIMANQDTLYIDCLVPIRDLGRANVKLHMIMETSREMMNIKDKNERMRLKESITSQISSINDLIDAYSKTYLVEEEVLHLGKFQNNWASAKELYKEFLSFAVQMKDVESERLFEGALNHAFDNASGNLDELINVNDRVAAEIDRSTDENARAGLNLLIIVLVSGIVISMSLGIFISKTIAQALNQMVVAADRISVGEINQRIDYESRDEIGQLAKSFRGMIEYVQGISVAAESIGKGNLNINISSKSPNDVLSNAFIRSAEVLKNIGKEIHEVNIAGKKGDLTVRGNASQFQGTYKEMVQGINDTLDSIVAPINEGNEVLYKMSKGDLSVRMHGTYQGDLNKMKQSINTVGESLSNTLKDVTVSIETTATASSEISASVEEMTSGLNEQSSQTSEVASAVEEMARTISENSESARNASETALKAKEYAQDGFNVVEETAVGMNRLAEIVRKSADTVHELGRSSIQIGEIIGVIGDIADQTNLLALNAAIEAARAGDQGRGFAVVADEVRKLSERTTKSTKEISTMIKKIQDETSGAVEAMEEGTKSVDQSIEQTENARKSLNHIVEISQKVTDMISNIANASNEQTKASDVISKSIDSISAVAQQSSVGNQQIARAMNDLNQQTDHLQKLISTFKLADDEKVHFQKQTRALRHEPKANTVVRENGTLAHNG
jgi:methyl-accepting chemotaxis protein